LKNPNKKIEKARLHIIERSAIKAIAGGALNINNSIDLNVGVRGQAVITNPTGKNVTLFRM